MANQTNYNLDFLENQLFQDIKVKHLFRLPYWFLWAALSTIIIFSSILLFTAIAIVASTTPVIGFILGPVCEILLSDLGLFIAFGVVVCVPGYCLYAFAEDIDNINREFFGFVLHLFGFSPDFPDSGIDDTSLLPPVSSAVTDIDRTATRQHSQQDGYSYSNNDASAQRLSPSGS